MLSYIDDLLDGITMYRLTLYYLIALVLAAIGLSAQGILHFGVTAIAASTLILVAACWVINKIFAAIFQAPTNVESVYITALILALIIPPMTSSTTVNITFLLAASGLATASKYILTIRKKHVFNPAAIAVVLTAIGPRQSASWWVGTTALLPVVIIGGILLVRKIRRGRMVFSFFASALLATIVYTLLAHGNVLSALNKTLLTSAMFFLGFVMLTEPSTAPPTAGKQTWYAILVGLLFPPQVHLLSLYSTPELALVAGNIFSYIISPKTKLFPTLRQKSRLTPDSVDFVFQPNQKLSYKPGQYMEWTLTHPKTDTRGNRRYFTLASSPTEPDIRIGVKFYKQSSSYKQALLEMTPETPIVAAQIAGDFVLPKDPGQKLVFIAGGIGITPYRSMIKYLLDRGEARPITMLYSAKTPNDFAYKDIFEQARLEIRLKVVYAVTDKSAFLPDRDTHSLPGRINAEVIKREVPDYQQRLFYISGTQAMTKDMQDILVSLGVPRHQIKVDYFPGYA
jgi:ferredoxin-NADP reductase/Na+-translocating ferredoxin:NAD+ oxidoreductase RnfD subunit